MNTPNKNLVLVIVLACCALAGGGTFLFLTRNHFSPPPLVPVPIVAQRVAPALPALRVFDGWEITGSKFASFEELLGFASDGGFVVVGRFGSFQFPARVISTHDDTNGISYQRKNGQIGKYEGYAGYQLKVVTVENSSGDETLVVLRAKERVAAVASITSGGASNPAVPPVTTGLDPNSAASLRLEADRRRQMFGNDSTNLADTLGSLSTVLGVEGKLAEAEAARRENLAIRRKALGNDNFRVATSLDALGTILQGERKLAEAETSFREALAIRRKVFGEQSSQVRDTLARLNEVLKAEGKPAAASINQDLDANRSKPDERAIVQPAQPFLTENLAVAKAWETLAADGYKTNEWRLQEWHNPSPALQQKAPDGTVEIFLLRNPVETISGTISFTKPGEHFREYRIRLEGNRVTCSYFRGL